MTSFIEGNTVVHLAQGNRSFGALIDSLLVEGGRVSRLT
jgi:hypothetical protein